MQKKLPPIALQRFFRWYCHPELVDHIEGDLFEEYGERLTKLGKRRADIRFAIDVLLLFRIGIIKRIEYSHVKPNGMYKSYWRVALRSIVKQRAYNILNVVGLAVGIAAGLLIATHSRYELSYENSIENFENIYRVHRDGWATTSPPLASEFRSFFPNIEAIGRFAPFGVRVVSTDNNNPGEATGFYADPEILDVFGFKILAGDSHPLSVTNTAVVTQTTAQRYFPNVDPIGKILRVDDRKDLIVTAVMADLPGNSHLQFDYLVSMPTFYIDGREDADSRRGWMIMYTYAKFKPGMYNIVSERMPLFIANYYRGEADVEEKISSKAWRLMPLSDIHLHSNLEKEMSPNSSVVYIYIFWVVEFLMLIVASANFVSLFTTQAIKRANEVGMRKILGARSGHVLLQFAAEISILTGVACLLSFAFSGVALPFYNDLSGRVMPLTELFARENVATLAVILLMVMLTSGLYPAFFVASFKAGSFLKTRRLPNATPGFIRTGLVVFQFAVSVSLIAAAIIVQQQMNLLKNKDLGFDKEQVISVKLYGDLMERSLLDAESFKNEFLKHPDILAAGRADRLIGERLSVETVVPVATTADEQLPDVRVLRADEGYLSAMNITLVDGRNFSRAFNDSTAYIINESAACLLGLTSPTGEALENRSNGAKKGKVVGVVNDYHYASLHNEIDPLIIEYSAGWLNHLVLKIRGKKTRETIQFIESTVKRLAPNSLFSYQFLDDRVNALYKSEQTMGKVFQFFSLLAMIIAALGLFGMSAYTIENRIKEISIRKVLGASLPAILKLISSRFVRMTLLSFAIGIPLTAYAMEKWLSNFAYKVGLSWWAFFGAGVAVLAITLLVTGFLAWGAAAKNPVESLKRE